MDCDVLATARAQLFQRVSYQTHHALAVHRGLATFIPILQMIYRSVRHFAAL